MSVKEIFTKNSRDAYVSLLDCLVNDTMIGESTILDLALLKIAEIADPVLYAQLKDQLNYDEIQKDVAHCYKSAQLRLRRRNQIAAAMKADSKGDQNA